MISIKIFIKVVKKWELYGYILSYNKIYYRTMIFKRVWKKESEVAQSCLTLCDPMDCSLPGSSVHGVFQATVLEWAAISFSRGSSRPKGRRSGLPFPSPGDLPDPRVESVSPTLQADALLSEPPGKPYVSVRRGPNPSRMAGMMNLELGASKPKTLEMQRT